VAENATDDPACHGATHVRIAAAGFNDLLAFHPAASLRRPHHGAHRGDARLEHAFVRTLPIFVVGSGQRRGRFVVVASAVVDRPHRGDTVFHPQPAQGVIAAAAQHRAAALEASVLADFPAAAIHDHR
jgi:hypothetical protein